MRFTREEYEKAIKDLRDGLTQLGPDGQNCAVCGDGSHQAWECRHNPLVKMREAETARQQWRCFHCGEVFTSDKGAEEHFGPVGRHDHPSCVRIANLIESLRAEEADSVEISCDNADFNGLPNSVVVCNGGWTNWNDVRFTGDTLVEALQAAADARAEREVPS